MSQFREVLQLLWQQIRLSIALFHDRSARLASVAAFALTILAVALAPDASPSSWDWTRILLVYGATLVALACFVTSRDGSIPPASQQQRLFAAALLVTLALLLAASFGIRAAIATSIAVTIAALVALAGNDGRSPGLGAAAIGAVIPLWVWTLLDAWHSGLLLLVPLAVLALVSDGHMRDATTPGTAAMSPRAHRLAGWLGALAGALLVLLAGLTGLDGDGSPAWLLVGATGAVLCLAADWAAPRLRWSPVSGQSVVLCDLALAWIAVCWLASL